MRMKRRVRKGIDRACKSINKKGRQVPKYKKPSLGPPNIEINISIFQKKTVKLTFREELELLSKKIEAEINKKRDEYLKGYIKSYRKLLKTSDMGNR